MSSGGSLSFRSNLVCCLSITQDLSLDRSIIYADKYHKHCCIPIKVVSLILDEMEQYESHAAVAP